MLRISLALPAVAVLVASTVFGADPEGAVAGHASIVVDAAKPGHRISPHLFGIFFEEINHAGDGGLYAELIRNRGFEDRTPEPWRLLQTGEAKGSMEAVNDDPLNPETPHSLRLTVTRPGPGRLGVCNSGYWGISVRKGAEYRLSFYARAAAGFTGPLTVSLEGLGATYARAQVGGLGAAWRHFACTLTATDSDPRAQLVITADKPCTVWLDMVSLFPRDTWKSRPNGLRPDLAEMLDALRPSFVRFPGGCFVEGDVIANAFRWKETIGDLARRPGHWNLWGYRSTDGLGLYEYLQMCEDLGAEPLLVINCGMACRGAVPMADMGPWVQDALDAIEYANGPTTSKWGALRARDGHPKPFDLEMMEIGNENSGPGYEQRYAMFWDAIKKRYPYMKLIADCRVTSRPMDIIDEHFYSSPEWFASQAHRYDSYSRKGPNIYVGEYACTQGCGKGNLRAALGEAAFMTGIERNSDVVVMASYAPLFVNVNNRAWSPDLIDFDSSRCYAIPSYYVQEMFSRNRGDVMLPAEIHSEARSTTAQGGIGLATWATEAEFRDIKVTHGDRVLFADDFSGGAGGASGWHVLRGDWRVADGAYQQTSADTDMRSTAGDPTWGDYTYSLKARKLRGAEGFLIMFHVRDADNFYWWNLGGWGNTHSAIEKCVGGAKTALGQSAPVTIDTGRWYDIKIELQGDQIRCYLDGKLITDAVDPPMMSLYGSASRVDKTGEVILKVVNFSGTAQRTDLRVEGIGKLAPTGTAIVLTSASPDAENSLDQPEKVYPKTGEFRCPGPRFDYDFPPDSLTILRLKPAR